MEENEINENNSNEFELINDSENNIEENNNFYQDFQNDAENYYQNKKEREEQKRKNDIRSFYYSILELFTKKQFKKIIDLFNSKDEEYEKEKEENNEDIENNENKLTYHSEWIFSFLNIISIERVIQKKVTKNKKDMNLINLKKYLDKENNIINNWLLFINALIKEHKRNKEDIQCFLEFTIEFILTKCINLGKYCIYKEKTTEAIYFLSLGIYLISHTSHFIKSPITFFLSAQLSIYLTSILIADNKFETAKNVINFSIKLLYIALETILFIDSKELSFTIFNILSKEKQNIELIIKIIFHMSISFYHLGICYENQGIPYFSFYAYKQAKFLLSIIKDLDEDIYTFYEFIIDIENRQLMRNRLILFSNKNIKKEKLIEEIKPKVKVYNAFIMNKKSKEEKFSKLENYISNMKLIDVDNEDPTLFDKIDKKFKTNVNIATKQIHLLDYLMSDEFKKIIKNMKKIRINKLDYETINIIQRQIINIKNNQREKLSKQYKNKLNNKSNNNKSLRQSTDIKKSPHHKTINTIPSSKTFNSAKRTRVSSGYKRSLTLLSDINESSSLYLLKSRPGTAHNDKYKQKLKFFSQNHPLAKRSLTINQINSILNIDSDNKKESFFLSHRINKKIQKDSIPQYSYDKYLFNKTFMNKKKNLEKQYSTEIDFQKKFLKCKEKEKTKPDSFSLKKVQSDCEKFFVTTFDKEMMKIREKKFLFANDYIKNIVKKKIKKSNINNTLNEFRKTKRFMPIFTNKENKKEEDVDENNYKYINSLMRDIDDLNKKEKLLHNNFRRKKNLKLMLYNN